MFSISIIVIVLLSRANQPANDGSNHARPHQLGPSAVSPGLKERVLDQLSMHFQLLAQTSILAVQARFSNVRVGVRSVPVYY